MARAGTLDVAINADPTGMVAGFGRSKMELKKFERELTSSTRSVGGAFQNLAVDLAVTGAAGQREIKRIVESGLQMAMVFGPTGLVVGALGLMVTSMVSGFQRAREEAEKAREEFDKTIKTLVKRHDVSAATDLAVEKYQKLREEQEKLRTLEADRERLGARLASLGPGGAQQFSQMSRSVEAQKALIKTLEEEHAAARAAADATAEYTAQLEQTRLSTEKWLGAREDANRAREREIKLVREAAAALADEVMAARRFADTRFGALLATPEFERGAELAVRRRLEQMMTLPDVTGYDEAMRDVRNFANELRAAAMESDGLSDSLGAGAQQFSAVFATALTGSVRRFDDFASQILAIWQQMLTEMIANQLFQQIFGPVVAGFGAQVFGAGGPLPTAPSIPDIDVGSVPSLGTQPIVNFNIQAMDGASVARVLQGAQGEIVRLVAQGVKGSRQAQRDIMGSA